MKNLTVLIAAAVAVCSLTSARAGEAFEVHAVPVRFAELDTASVAGATELYRRIEFAAKSSCRELEPGQVLSLVQPYAACLHSAIVAAVLKVNRPSVTACAVARGTLPAAPLAIASAK